MTIAFTDDQKVIDQFEDRIPMVPRSMVLTVSKTWQIVLQQP